jgi:hypothetical protein
MAIFCITFRIHEDATYTERYESVVAAIKRCCHGPYWDQPTSFFLFENPSSSQAIAGWIDQNSKFAASKDVLLVTNLSQNGYAVIGNVQNRQTLDALMKKR